MTLHLTFKSLAKLSFDELGNFHKEYEKRCPPLQFPPGSPIIARLDGRSFHKFTRFMGKPFDRGLTTSMEDTTRDLMEAFGANIGYTQSDEITLIWGNPFPIRGDDSTLIFSGKLQKLCSNLASYCTLSFFIRIVEYHSEALEEKPIFDCRLWQVPSMEVALSNIDWRRRDAIKNSISMAATCYFSHNSLLGVGSKKRKQMLADKGIIWEEYPGYFKEGTLLLKQEIKSELSEEEKERIPEPFREVADTLTRKVYRGISFKELIETLSVV